MKNKILLLLCLGDKIKFNIQLNPDKISEISCLILLSFTTEEKKYPFV